MLREILTQTCLMTLVTLTFDLDLLKLLEATVKIKKNLNKMHGGFLQLNYELT